VYEYTERHIRHIGTEPCAESFSSSDSTYALCDQNDAPRLLQVPSIENIQSNQLKLRVHIRNLGANDDNCREIRHCTIDSPSESEEVSLFQNCVTFM
jgi:hypothetical protein